MTEDAEFQLDRVRRNAESCRTFIGGRDDAILLAHAAGASFQQIADAAKMTHQGVRKIVAKGVDNSVEDATIET